MTNPLIYYYLLILRLIDLGRLATANKIIIFITFNFITLYCLVEPQKCNLC